MFGMHMNSGLTIVLVIIAVVMIVALTWGIWANATSQHRRDQAPPPPASRDPLDVLRERYAHGEHRQPGIRGAPSRLGGRARALSRTLGTLLRTGTPRAAIRSSHRADASGVPDDPLATRRGARVAPARGSSFALVGLP